MIALFMAGGSGTRLWPVSRADSPKQLHALVGGKSLMTQTVERVAPLVSPGDVWVVTNENYAERIAEHSPGVPRRQIISEPFPLGTNLAVGLGAAHIALEQPDAVIMVGWADAHIGRDADFRRALEQAGRAADADGIDGVILGVRPTYPATAYGYIELGEDRGGGAFRIARFIEKPDSERAGEFHRSGNHYWNSGISVWKVSKLLNLIRRFTPDHFAALQYVAGAGVGTREAAVRMREVFGYLEKTPIDTAIFERAEHLAAVPVDLDWNDIGAWSALYDVQAMEADDGNVTRGTVVAVDTDQCLIYADKRLIATLGVSNLVIVETDDAILIAEKGQTERLKELHAEVEAIGGGRFL